MVAEGHQHRPRQENNLIFIDRTKKSGKLNQNTNLHLRLDHQGEVILPSSVWECRVVA